MIYYAFSAKINVEIFEEVKMKKIISLFLVIIIALFALVSCDGYYRPVESSDDESKTVIKLNFGDEVYEVKYEFYRALFLTLKGEVDGGDESVWQSAEKDAYVEKVDELIFERLTDIYAVFSLAADVGIDVYSKDYDNSVLEIVKASVDGGIIAGSEYSGFDGDYEAYLESLHEMNLNYSVQDLMIRYALAVDDIFYYYGGDVDNAAKPGALNYTKEDVLEFYNSDGCVRVYQLYLSKNRTSFTIESASALRDRIAAKDSESAVVATMIGSSTYGDNIKDGMVIGKYNLDEFYYKELTDAAFALSYYETSPVIEISTAVDDGFFILYRTTKSAEHFESCYDDIASIYVDDVLGKMINDRADALLSTLLKTEAYAELNHANISMD